MNKLNLAPGSYKTPLMQHSRITGSEDPNVIQLEFLTGTVHQGQSVQLTIVVPISTLDATGLLRGLRMLQERGLLPSVPEAPTTTEQ